MRRLQHLLLLAAAAALAACNLGPDYSRPQLDMPAAYKSATQPATEPATQPAAHLQTDWWKLFNDDDLNALEDAALQHNPDLKAAMLRIAQARAAARSVESGYYPEITLDPNLNYSIVTGGNGNTVTATTLRVPFDLAYEIDIWGQVTRSLEAANANTRGTADQAAVILQTLEADVAQNYILLRSLEQQDDIFTENVKLTEEQLDLTKRKLQAGIVGKIDVAQAQTQLDTLRTQQLDIHRQRADTEHALAILTGRAPADFSLAKSDRVIALPDIPPGLPGDILRHRPDIVSAEENLIAANANVGVAITAFYPTLRLTGTAGFENVNLQSALSWPAALFNFGPSLSVPIFEGGRLEANLAQSKARYQELVATYQSTILTALRDIEISLTDVHMRTDALAAQHAATESARNYQRLSKLEYDQGLESYLQLLDADRTLLTNQLTESQLLSQRLISTVLLVKALGGGWDPSQTSLTLQDPPSPQTSSR